MLEMILIATTFLLVLVTLLPLIPSSHYFFKSWEFPRVQILILLVVNLLACIILLDDNTRWITASVSTVAAIYQSIWIIPYTPIVPKRVKLNDDHKQSLKILTCNVLMPNRSYSKLLDIISEHKPDIIVTLETDQKWQDALQPIREHYPHSVDKPLDNLYGMHVFSRFPLEDVEVRELIQEGVPSIHTYVRVSDSMRIKFHFLHPAPPSPTENTFSKSRDIELLLIADLVKPDEEPTIVTGDLNDVAWSPTTLKFRHKSKLLDPRIGRGIFNTFHAKYWFMRWPLDHIFHSEHFAFKEVKRMPSIDSDHFPLLSHLSFNDTDKS